MSQKSFRPRNSKINDGTQTETLSRRRKDDTEQRVFMLQRKETLEITVLCGEFSISASFHKFAK
jgi:hypothetical protein